MIRPRLFPHASAVAWKFPLFLLALLFLAGALAGCANETAIRHAKVSAKILRADARDAALGSRARELAEDAADAFDVQLYLLTGEELPPETMKRLEPYLEALEEAE